MKGLDQLGVCSDESKGDQKGSSLNLGLYFSQAIRSLVKGGGSIVLGAQVCEGRCPMNLDLFLIVARQLLQLHPSYPLSRMLEGGRQQRENRSVCVQILSKKVSNRLLLTLLCHMVTCSGKGVWEVFQLCTLLYPAKSGSKNKEEREDEYQIDCKLLHFPTISMEGYEGSRKKHPLVITRFSFRQEFFDQSKGDGK